MVESNLDRISAQIGFNIVESFKHKEDFEKLETIVNKALGILIEDGLFAYAIWLKSRGDKERKYTKTIENKSLELLKNKNINLTNKNDLMTAILDDISTNIQKTLLARQLLEKMLIYARYRAKALQKSGEMS